MKLGLIVGTGMDYLVPENEWQEAATPYGYTVTGAVTLGGKEVVLVRRHGPGLNVPPHLVNYRANLWAMREAGVKGILTTSAVGSLRRDLKPGSLAVVHDFIDLTRRRGSTIYDQPGEKVIHTDMTESYCSVLSSAIEYAAADMDVVLAPHVVYVCVDGPRYETPAEIKMFAKWGAHVVGMTAVPEVVIAAELDMCYGSLAIVTNYGAGISPHRLSHQEVVEMVENRREQVHGILERAFAILPESGLSCSVA